MEDDVGGPGTRTFCARIAARSVPESLDDETPGRGRRFVFAWREAGYGRQFRHPLWGTRPSQVAL